MAAKTLLGSANRFVSMMPFVDTVDIPNDLSLVTDIGDEFPAAELGLSEDCTANIWSTVEDFYRTRLHNQITLCVRREGKVILNRSLGMASGSYGKDGAVAGSIDTPFCQFSASKAVSALLLMKFEELGELKLDDKISKYIPKFSQFGKHAVTLDELISHRSKVPSISVDDPRHIADHDFILEHLCNAEPHSAKQAYHAISGGFIIAEVIEKITGKSVSSALNTYFRKPLGMKYFTYGLQKRYRNKQSVPHKAGIPLIYPLTKLPKQILGLDMDSVLEVANSDYFQGAVLPAGNMYATAEEASRFYQMLLDDGKYNGQQVLQAKTVKKALSGNFLPSWDHTLNLPVNFSRGGLMLNTLPTRLFGWNAPSAYGHLGFINILTWADPQRQLSVGLMTSGKPFAGPHVLNFVKVPNSINSNCPNL